MSFRELRSESPGGVVARGLPSAVYRRREGLEGAVNLKTMPGSGVGCLC